MSIPSGYIASRFGAKPLIAAALVSASAISFATPLVVYVGGAPALIVLRFVMGLSQGGLFPACTALLSAWAPLHERGRLASMIYCGAPAGMLIGNLLSGILSEWHGWQMIFYVFGFFSGIIAILYVSHFWIDQNSIPDIDTPFFFRLIFARVIPLTIRISVLKSSII